MTWKIYDVVGLVEDYCPSILIKAKECMSLRVDFEHTCVYWIVFVRRNCCHDWLLMMNGQKECEKMMNLAREQLAKMDNQVEIQMET